MDAKVKVPFAGNLELWQVLSFKHGKPIALCARLPSLLILHKFCFRLLLVCMSVARNSAMLISAFPVYSTSFLSESSSYVQCHVLNCNSKTFTCNLAVCWRGLKLVQTLCVGLVFLWEAQLWYLAQQFVNVYKADADAVFGEWCLVIFTGGF